MTSFAQRCLKDLRERFAKVEIQSSAPIVPFRETALKAPGKASSSALQSSSDNQSDMAPTKTPNAPRGTIKGTSSQQVVSFTIRASPMPKPILDFILENLEVWKILQHNREIQQGNASEKDEQVENYGDVVRKPTVTPEHFWDIFSEKCKEAGGEWVNVADKTWAFGPQKAGACLLVDSRSPKPYASSVFFYFPLFLCPESFW